MSEMTQDEQRWFGTKGRICDREPKRDWADVLVACQGIISFDAMLCYGPRHSALTVASSKSTVNGTCWYNYTDAYLRPEVANYVMTPCENCHSAPERFARYMESSLDRFPILGPPPLHSSRAKDAKALSFSPNDNLKFLVRCHSCIQNRWCRNCNKWWCEDCYTTANDGGSSSFESSIGGPLRGGDDASQKRMFKVYNSFSLLKDRHKKCHSRITIGRHHINGYRNDEQTHQMSLFEFLVKFSTNPILSQMGLYRTCVGCGFVVSASHTSMPSATQELIKT